MPFERYQITLISRLAVSPYYSDSVLPTFIQIHTHTHMSCTCEHCETHRFETKRAYALHLSVSNSLKHFTSQLHIDLVSTGEECRDIIHRPSLVCETFTADTYCSN